MEFYFSADEEGSPLPLVDAGYQIGEDTDSDEGDGDDDDDYDDCSSAEYWERYQDELDECTDDFSDSTSGLWSPWAASRSSSLSAASSDMPLDVLFPRKERSASSTRRDVAAGVDATVCVGLASRSMPLTSVVGRHPGSIAFCSSGHVYIGGAKQRVLAGSVPSGSVVGILFQHNHAHEASVMITLNGHIVASLQSVAIAAGVPLYPTVSLLKPDVGVACSFDAVSPSFARTTCRAGW